MDIIEIYKVILANAGMIADDEGFVSANLSEDLREPIMIGDRRLVLPTRNQLATTNIGSRVIFHPLHESLIRGESDVMTRTRELANARLNIAFSYFMLALLQLATSPTEHVHLKPDQTLFMDCLQEIEEGITETFDKILKAMGVSQDGKCFMRIFVKRGGKIEGRSCQRLAVVSFPLYEELIKRPASGQPNMVYGVRVKKAERETLISLLEYMVPHIGVPDFYNRGSYSTEAPTLDCVMQAIRATGALINEMAELFDRFIPESNKWLFPMDWVETFKDLSKIRAKINLIPSQPGNEGKMPVSDRHQIDVSTVPVVKMEPLPWEEERVEVASEVVEAEAPRTTIFGTPVAPASAPRPTLVTPQVRVQNLPVQHQQYQHTHTPGVVTQSTNKFLPNYVPPVGGHNPYNTGYGGNPYSPQMQVRPPHVPIWAQGPMPGYANGYGRGNGGNNNGGGGFGSI